MGLIIKLIGVVRIRHRHIPMDTKLSHAAGGLLAYLVLFRDRIHTRDVLAGTFWGDYSEKRAHRNLSTTLWRLRKVLEPDGIPRGTYLKTPSMREICFNPDSNPWIDVAILEKHARHVLEKSTIKVEPGHIQEFEKALELYTSDLLEGYYDDWALSERERLRSLYLKSQAYLLSYYRKKGVYDRALAHGRRILNLDPLREEIHREIMRLYSANGQRALALRQYETCRSILKQELDVEPMEETQALCIELKKETPHISTPRLQHMPFGSAHTALQEIHQASLYFDRAKKRLDRTAKYLQEFLEK